MTRPRQIPARAPLTAGEISAAHYVGSGEHKTKRWWGGLPGAFVGPDGVSRRPGKQLTTPCPKTTEEQREEVSHWVRHALAAGQYRFYEGDGIYPKHVWYRDSDGQYWFGFAVNQLAGSYKGWPIEEEESVRHSIVWCEDALNAAPEEQATVADLQLFVGRLNVTQHLDSGNLGDRVTVSLYGPAHGIAHDWWTIFGVRDRTVSLTRYRTGYLLPDLRFGFDGAAFEIQAYQCVYEQADVRFWAGPSEVLSRTDGEAWLSSLIDEVLARLRQRGLPDTSAALRWKRVMASRRSEEAVFCEAAGSLGIDPYQIDEATARFIEKAEGLFEREALIEFVSGAGNVDRSRLLQWVERMARDRGFQYRLANLRSLVDETVRDTPPRPDEKAWAAGYRRARRARRLLNIDQSSRFRSFRDLALRLGASRNYNVAPRVDGIRALRRDREDGLHVHLRNHGETQEAASAHLFALARAVGDAACFPDPQIGPITELRSAYRQAAGRAFAAEFLAPSDEIEAMLAERRDVVTIANEFAVSQQVIDNQIINRERIVAATAE